MKLENISNKKTKIIATTGPSFESEEMMEKMFKAGVNAIRMNTSHGDISEHNFRLQNARKIQQKLQIPISVILDTQGPEIRVHQIEHNKMLVRINDILKIHCKKEILGKDNEFSITYKELANTITKEQLIMVDDGKLSLKTLEIDKKNGIVTVLALNNHYVGTKKAVNIPGIELKLPFISERDKNFITWGIKAGIDYVAASFVRDKQDLNELKKLLKTLKGDDVEIISKIESLKSITNLTEIIVESDAIMFARGDLGVEIPFYEVPFYEKLIINKCRAQGKPIIIATQMLDSMSNNPRPTRAEVTDIYYAVTSGTDAIMLSGESASGNFPLESVEVMAKIALEAEKNYNYLESFENGYAYVDTINAESSYLIVKNTLTSDAKYILAFSEHGRLVKALSRFRPNAIIIGLIKDKTLINKLGMNYGVYVQNISTLEDYHNDEKIIKIAREMGIPEGKFILAATKREFKKIEIK